MKVLVIPSWYPIGEDELMGIYHKEFTEALNNDEIDSNILFIDRQRLTNPIKYLFVKKKNILNEKNYKVYLYKMLNLEKISYKLQMNNYTKKMIKAFKNYLKTNELPDVIHAQVALPAGYAACKIGKMYNIPVIVTEHYSKFENFYKNPEFKQYSDFVIKNSTYSTVSNYMKKVMLKYINKCLIIPNLVDVKLFNNNLNRTINKTFNLVTISALRKGKKIEITLKAIKLLIDKNINIHLDIIGDGFNLDYYKELCNELNINNYVSFLGKKTKKEIADKLKEEHTLIISSELETFGIPGIEAMASGLPIISTNCLGPNEYIDDKTGIICKINDYKDMAKAIEKLYNNYSKYDSKYIMKRADKYSSKEIIKHTKNIYTDIIKNNK